MATLKPSRPSAPRRLSAPIKALSKKRGHDGTPRAPILSSLRPTLSPGVPLSTMNRWVPSGSPSQPLGLRGHEDEVRDAGIGAPDLGAVEHIAIGRAARARLDARDVRPALRFGQGQRAAQLAAGQARQQALLLRRGATGKDGAEGRPLNHQQVAGVVADATELLDRDAGRRACCRFRRIRQGRAARTGRAPSAVHTCRAGTRQCGRSRRRAVRPSRAQRAGSGPGSPSGRRSTHGSRQAPQSNM